jgi:CheY-like chemotaxis protein
MVGSGKKLILVVEDDKDIRSSVIEVLEDAGFQTCSAGNGAEALELLRKGPVPDLILLDLMMPIMDGFSFREEQIKVAAWAAIPVVIMSADGNIMAKKERAGTAGYIKKPLDIVDLINTVEKHI